MTTFSTTVATFIHTYPHALPTQPHTFSTLFAQPFPRLYTAFPPPSHSLSTVFTHVIHTYPLLIHSTNAYSTDFIEPYTATHSHSLPTYPQSCQHGYPHSRALSTHPYGSPLPCRGHHSHTPTAHNSPAADILHTPLRLAIVLLRTFATIPIKTSLLRHKI